MSGYFDASLRALSAAGVDVTLVYREPESNAPFDPTAFGHGGRSISWADADGPGRALAGLSGLAPDVLLVSSWNFREYLKYARETKNQRPACLTVMGMDNQWLDTPRQWLGRAVAPWYVARGFDAAFVAGDRQVAFAERVGFRRRPIFQGLYCADDETFRLEKHPWDAPSFLYAGRLIPSIKGVETLLAAYRTYRAKVSEPWPLRIAGTGPLETALSETPGVILEGFAQPAALAAIMARSACLVLPSAFEPWGVVAHEAALTGLPLLLSSRVGAAAAFLREGRNGESFPAGSVDLLAARLLQIHHSPSERLEQMSLASRELAVTSTTSAWASKFVADADWLSSHRRNTGVPDRLSPPKLPSSSRRRPRPRVTRVRWTLLTPRSKSTEPAATGRRPVGHGILVREMARGAVSSAVNHHRPSAASDVAIVSSPRSGSTWVLEMLSSLPRYASRDEPDHPLLMQLHGYPMPRRGFYFVDSDAYERECLYGYLRDDSCVRRFGPPFPWYPGWSFQSRRRILKLLRVGPIVEDFAAESGFEILALVRHPIAQSLSCVRRGHVSALPDFLGSPEYLERWLPRPARARVEQISRTDDLLGKFVCEWVLSNLPMLGRYADLGIPLFSYEQLVRAGSEAPTALAAAVGARIDPASDLARRPSRTSDSSDPATVAQIRAGRVDDVLDRWRSLVDASVTERLMDLTLELGIPAETLQDWA
jgi:glycosyltransferase involved in cell wall biosynthesis